MIKFATLVLGFFMLVSACDPVLAAKKKSKKPVVSLDPVMTFHIVRKSDPLCEPSCPQWIAAEGRIDAGTPGRLRKIFKSLGKTKLPIVLSSGGGDVTAALSMAQMIRDKSLTVAIGTTIYFRCSPTDKTCKLPPEQNGVFRGTPDPGIAYCFSACPFVLAGGVVRIVSPFARIGVHQITNTPAREWITYRETYRIVNGKKKVLSRKEVSRKTVIGKTTTKISKAQRQVYRNHFKKMGIDVAFLDLLERAGPQEMYILKPEELKAFRIRTAALNPDVLSRSSMCMPETMANHCVKLP